MTITMTLQASWAPSNCSTELKMAVGQSLPLTTSPHGRLCEKIANTVSHSGSPREKKIPILVWFVPLMTHLSSSHLVFIFGGFWGSFAFVCSSLWVHFPPNCGCILDLQLVLLQAKVRNLMRAEWGMCDAHDGLMHEHQNKHTHTHNLNTLFLTICAQGFEFKVSRYFFKYSDALS